MNQDAAQDSGCRQFGQGEVFDVRKSETASVLEWFKV